jgi:hypothetical protein
MFFVAPVAVFEWFLTESNPRQWSTAYEVANGPKCGGETANDRRHHLLSARDVFFHGDWADGGVSP